MRWAGQGRAVWLACAGWMLAPCRAWQVRQRGASEVWSPQALFWDDGEDPV